MIGQSTVFLDTLALISKIGRCDAPVLIEGETGTGKELAARAIHYGSARREGPFIPVNCGAIPDALIENELFGHKQGAYTDARRDHEGLVGNAQNGTLFLDEIDALTPKAQVTLLRFLQDQQYRPLGGADVRHASVRIVAASNADIDVLVERGNFRSDLLFRIRLMALKLPPLRQRSGDAALLANHFLHACVARFGPEKIINPETLQWFERYSWPGNVRELENLICREYLLADGNNICIQPPALLNGERRVRSDRRRLSFETDSFHQAKNKAIAEFERRYLEAVLLVTEGNVTRAASMVGKERRAFGKLLKKYGIDRLSYAE
ncbi:MAG: sigma-54-dependent Fis family transcriptional regulator [Gammaproteobacteria bacterium]|nr:sigma-54-dependent Fis family transcriptional regulator [Gammaproteobacteria bacterium]